MLWNKRKFQHCVYWYKKKTTKKKQKWQKFGMEKNIFKEISELSAF